MIKQSMPLLERKDFHYIRHILNSGQVARGGFTEALELRFRKIIALRHSFATSSGTSALHLAMLSLGILEGDEIIIPSYACAALLNVVNYLKAVPVLADIDPETFNLTSDTIKRKISKKTKAIIVTHTFGFPADTDKILMFGIPVVEDCAHSIGSLYKGKPTGAGGRLSIFSMYATKMFSSGEGGMVCTDDNKLAAQIHDLNNPDMRDGYRVRYNYKMSDLTAGLAISQLERLDSFVERRMLIAKRYRDSFSCLPVKFQKILSGTRPNYYRFIICAPGAENIIKITQKRGVMCDRPIYKPLHSYLSTKKSTNFPGSDMVWNNAVSVPIYPALKDRQITEVIKTVLTAFRCSK